MIIYIVMGVSGSGKSTIGKLLAEELGCNFYDADDFHPPHNIAKMSQGVPLTDSDRLPWLAAIKSLLLTLNNRSLGLPKNLICHPERSEGSHQIDHVKEDFRKTSNNSVIACSALKASYREYLQENLPEFIWIYLKGDHALLLERMQQRENHFMKSEMLRSQFETLEEPNSAIIINISQPPGVIIKEIIGLSNDKIKAIKA